LAGRQESESKVYRRTERTESRLADDRARILEAARTLVAEHGFRGTSVALVASMAGVAVGTVYRHFPSKAKLFAEIVRAVSQREVDVLRGIAQSPGSASERLTAAVGAFASRALRRRGLAYAVIAEPVDPEVDDVRLEYRRIHCSTFEKILREGIRNGEFPSQHVVASAACLVGAFIEGLVGSLAMDSANDLGNDAELLDAIEQFALRAVSGQTSPRAQRHVGI
jgi:AcrR family transcriptional regulator